MDKPLTYWDNFTTSYQMGEQKHRMYLLDLLAKKGVKSLVDVGCGTGPIWEIIKNHRDKYDFAYLGVDYSQGMIEVCKSTFPDVTWKVEDARHLEEKDNSWDCVLLMHCLDHLDDYQSAIKEATRVSKKYVCIVLWRSFINGEYNNLNPRNMYGKKDGEKPWEDTYLQEYSRSALEKEFEKNNLKVIHTAEGDTINDPGRYNFLFLLEKC